MARRRRWSRSVMSPRTWSCWRATPEMFDPEIVGAEMGFGGGDSQIWIADAQFRAEDRQ